MHKLPRIPLCFEKASNDELFEHMEIFLLSDGLKNKCSIYLTSILFHFYLGEGDKGTGAGRESMTGS